MSVNDAVVVLMLVIVVELAYSTMFLYVKYRANTLAVSVAASQRSFRHKPRSVAK